MIYEWRVYEIIPGKRKALNERFAKSTIRLFEKHGMKVIGFWENLVGGSTNTLYYMLAFEDLGHLESAWKSFKADPEWIEVVASTEKDGPLVVHEYNLALSPTDYSPMK
jgi:NIPSNAP